MDMAHFVCPFISRCACGSLCLLATVTDAAMSIPVQFLRGHVFLFLLDMAEWFLKAKALHV